MKRLLSAILGWLLSTQLVLAAPQVAPCNDAVATTATATFAAVANLTWWIYGYQITSSGATGATAAGVNATITNLSGGTPLNISAGHTGTGNGTTITVTFPTPIPASGVNTAVVISVPTFGSGATHASCALFGELR